MDLNKLINQMNRLHKEELEIVEKKSKDYSGEKDVFLNFKWFGELGFLVRMFDKLMRIKNIIEKGVYNVNNETLKDSLMDLVNYSNLLILYLNEKEKK